MRAMPPVSSAFGSPFWSLVTRCGEALLIAVSRVMVGAHSVSEVAAGLLVGGMVSGSALWVARMREAAVPLWLPACVALWLTLTPAHAPASTTHDMVTRLALSLS